MRMETWCRCAEVVLRSRNILHRRTLKVCYPLEDQIQSLGVAGVGMGAVAAVTGHGEEMIGDRCKSTSSCRSKVGLIAGIVVIVLLCVGKRWFHIRRDTSRAIMIHLELGTSVLSSPSSGY